MNNLTTYPVHELFHTFQGEGVNVGQPAFFIRLFGCPLRCAWCDAAGTWHPDHVPTSVPRMRADELQKEVDKSGAPLVVVTGGEPCIHNLDPLVAAIHAGSMWQTEVALETSGAFEITGAFDWITVSPKRQRMPVASSYCRASEFKIIVESPADIDFYGENLRQFVGTLDHPPIWLHPEWSHREDPVVLGAISDAVKTYKGFFRAGWQLHKLYQVDYRDARVQAPVPLGGDLRKGY